MRCREWVDAFPTHKWMARLLPPAYVVQRVTQFIPNDTADAIVLIYLVWLSEVTMHESWLARRLAKEAAKDDSASE